MRVSLNSGELELGGEGGPQRRKVGSTDLARMRGWARHYEEAMASGADETLPHLGRELFSWLDGDRQWLAQLRSASGPRLLELATEEVETSGGRAFLDAPWELLADEFGFLALETERPFLVSRRLSPTSEPQAPRFRDIQLVFMAAAPRGAQELDFDLEEDGILRATERLPLRLDVEESGNLAALEARLASLAPVEIVHLSCHGATVVGRGPVLALEDPRGFPHPAEAEALVAALGAAPPPLVVLSACRTADSVEAASSLAVRLVRAGLANVIGWAGPVRDIDARAYARALYAELAHCRSVPHAAAAARTALLREYAKADTEAWPNFSRLPKEVAGRDWHMARVYLGEAGGGALCAATRPSRAPGPPPTRGAVTTAPAAANPILEAPGFVGRRPAVQAMLRAFAAGERSGALIHGMAQTGKSSLAGRIAGRMPAHRTVLFSNPHRGPGEILDGIRAALSADAREASVRHWPEVEAADETSLQAAFTEILEGPCGTRDAAAGRTPILLILDDLRHLLEAPRRGERLTRVKAQHLPMLRALLTGFATARTESRLLLTSRFDFSAADVSGEDPAARLFRWPLAAMDRRETEKLLRAMQEVRDASTREDGAKRALLRRYGARQSRAACRPCAPRPRITQSRSGRAGGGRAVPHVW